MITASDLRKGTTFEWEDELYRVVEYQHSFIGRGSANVRVKLRNLRTGTMTDHTFSPDDRIDDIRCLSLPEQAAPLPVRLPEAPVVEGESHEPALGKGLRVLGQDELLDAGEPVTEDDARHPSFSAGPVRKIENPGEPGPLGVEMNALRRHRLLLCSPRDCRP